MPKLTVNTVVVDPATGAPAALAAGDDVPDWATSLVGDHLIAKESEPAKPARSAKQP